MISQIEEPMTFIADLKNYNENFLKTSPDWLADIRLNGFERFKSLGFPTLKDEEWKYISLGTLAKRKFTIPKEAKAPSSKKLEAYLDRSEINLVFINGHFSKEYSNLSKLPKGVVVETLFETFSKSNGALKPYFEKYHKQLDNTFTALNDACFANGAYVKIDRKVVIDRLIHIVHLTDGKADDVITFPRSLIVLEPSAEASVLESHITFTDSKYLSDAVTDIFMDTNSKFCYVKGQEESPQAYHIGQTRIWQEKDSQLESFSLMTGATLTRNNLLITLNGEGISSVLNGLYALTNKQVVDNHTAVDHRAPNCTSRQLYKGILHDGARGVFNGKIFVQREAQLTNAYQLNKNILLTKGCQIDTKPQLEIFADDVKCTHGATIGQLDEDQIFYLQSRAVSKSNAIKMLSRGFIEDIILGVDNEAIRHKLEKLLLRVLSVIS